MKITLLVIRDDQGEHSIEYHRVLSERETVRQY